MDGSRFDDLVRAVATGAGSRRALLGRLTGAGAGAMLAMLGRGADAAPNSCAQACADEPKGPRQAACKQACRQCDGNIFDVCRGPQIICCPGSQGFCCIDEGGSTVCPGSQTCQEPRVPVGCECVCPPEMPTDCGGECREACPAGSFFNFNTCSCQVAGVCEGDGLVCGANESVQCGASGPYGFCLCAGTAGGETTCIEVSDCGAFGLCETNEECGSGRVCALNTCCGTGVCVNPCGT